MQASNIFSVGGSISANIHGSDHSAGTISNVVNSITIINAKGDLEIIHKSHDLFGYILGGYGLFGIIVEATIELCENHNLIKKQELIPLNKYIDYFKQKIKQDEDIKLHLYDLSIDPNKLLKEGYVTSYVKDSTEVKPPPSNLIDEPEEGTFIDRLLLKLVQYPYLSFVRSLYWENKINSILNMKVSRVPPITRNEVMRINVNAMLSLITSQQEWWLQEYFLPENQLLNFLEKFSEILTRNDVRLINASIRFAKQDKTTKLAYAKGGDRFSVVICFLQDLDQKSRG